MESQKPASHSFHEPLGNLAERRRDSHIPTAPATTADGKVENQKQVSHFPTASISLAQKKKEKDRLRAGFVLHPRRRFARLSGPLFLRRDGLLSLRP
jgi:hypothetical protein